MGKLLLALVVGVACAGPGRGAAVPPLQKLLGSEDAAARRQQRADSTSSVMHTSALRSMAALLLVSSEAHSFNQGFSLSDSRFKIARGVHASKHSTGLGVSRFRTSLASMSVQNKNDDAETPSAVADHPSQESLLDMFFDSWNKGDAAQLMALVTDDASIHWKKLNQFLPGAKWITWSKDVLQYCADDECSIYERYEGKNQELRDFDKFCTDMASGFEEKSDERVVHTETTDNGELLMEVNTKATYNRMQGKVKIGLTVLGDKIKDIKIEVRC